MRFRLTPIWLVLALQLCVGALSVRCAQTQLATGVLRGQVTDPSGAVVADATVVVTMPTGEALTAATNREGIFEIKGLAPGKYSL